jgi:hypothetical protein
MKTAFEICLLLLLVGVPVQLYYWFVLRFVVLIKMRHEIQCITHKLQTLETSREGQAALSVLVNKCNRALRWMYDFDIVVAMVTTCPKEIELQVKRDAEVISNAPFELREFNKQIDHLVAICALANSPGFVALCLILTPILFAVLLGCLAVGKLRGLLTKLDRKLWADVYMPNHC